MSKAGDSAAAHGWGKLKDLCWHVCKPLPEDEIKKIYRSTIIKVSSLGSANANGSSFSEGDEFVLCQNIEKHLQRIGKEKEIIRFHHLYKRLKSPECQKVVKDKQAVVSFLLNVSQKKNAHKTDEPFFLPSAKNNRGKVPSTPALPKALGDLYANRSLSSPTSDDSLASAKRPTSFSNFSANQSHDKQLQVNRLARPKTSRSTDSLSLMSASPHYNNKYIRTQVSQSALLLELVYSFQGIPGSILKLDPQQAFFIDPQVRVPQAPVVMSLLEVGYLHNKVTSQYCHVGKGGAVSSAVEAGIRKVMRDYYGAVGLINTEVISSSNYYSDDTPLQEESSDGITLRRLVLFASKYVRILQCICELINVSKNAKGGAIISAIDMLRHHGDKEYSATVNVIFGYACKPLMTMITTWVVEGNLYDPEDEFFIAVNSMCHDRDIWREKFILRPSLIPNFIAQHQAEMILRAGKAINFLNVICNEKVAITGARLELYRMKELDLIDLDDPRSPLANLITRIFEETSKLVLETLVTDFKLFQHFQGLRRYILLGQGDFATYFMELIEPEMRKPASNIQYHELMSLLGIAIRGSTAVHEDPEIIKNVSVKILVASGGDWGSDVFGLQYLMHETLDAALGISGGAYSHMFNFLWRTKRMEHVLLSLRKSRWTIKNELYWLASRVEDVNYVLALADSLSQELVHFARQFHYYILFEVVECVWEQFSNSFKKASSFDDVIEAHDKFISEIQAKTFQDENSRSFITELRLIWDLVFELENLEKRFFHRVSSETAMRKEREKRVALEGTDYQEEASFNVKNKELKTFLASIRAQYTIIMRSYQEVLKKFLLDLSVRKDHQLRLLSARIDYNEHYKKIDARITDSMKFSRCSDLFL